MGIVKRLLKGSIMGVALLAAVLLTPGMASAMQFSEPVLIGDLGARVKSGGMKYFPRMALPSSNPGFYYDYQGQKEVLRFYLRAATGADQRLGSSNDMNNTIVVPGLMDWNSIYEVPSDSNRKFYVFVYSGSDAFAGATILGTNKDNKYVKYIDSVGFVKAQAGAIPNFLGAMGHANGIRFSIRGGDTLIIDCGTQQQWRYLLKWDEKAQWFGIAIEKL